MERVPASVLNPIASQGLYSKIFGMYRGSKHWTSSRHHKMRPVEILLCGDRILLLRLSPILIDYSWSIQPGLTGALDRKKQIWHKRCP